ncbi:DUF637 domain-containing protein [Limnohabitans curvus]|uniref:DUF637 domain-containing protein n=1 Tax=Limnohabitans curvus TaxID=323423 RepID=UPI001473AB45|nr:DUF637 domain-containing protein [Limnohabitans curvus]
MEDKTTQVGSDVKGATVEISAGKDLTTVASTIEGSDVSLSAQGKIDYLAALNVDKKEVQSKSSSSWFGIDIRFFSLLQTAKSETNDSSIQTRAAATQLQSEGDILSQSGGDTKLQGTQVKAQNFTVNAGVGAKADPNAKILIEGVKETLQTSHTQKSESLVWQSMSGNGSTTETAVLANIQAKTKFSAPGGIDVQLPPGEPLKEQIKTLSQQPGMEWLSDLSQRKDVNWQEIKLAKDSWSYDQQGLTPAGAAILAIAIAAYTGGMGAGVVGTTGAAAGGASVTTLGGVTLATTTAAGVTTVTAYGAAVNAGFAALASSAGVSFVNNGGDIGKTLKDMGSSQNVKGVLTAMATAGVLAELGSTPTATGQTGANAQVVSTTQAVDKFTANLMQNVTNNLASAVVSSAINGTPLNEDTLSTALSSALITAGMAQTANSIGAAATGTNPTLNAYTQALAHALAGCVGGAATTGNSGGCSAGAVGAVVGELSAGYAKSTGATDANALAFAKSMSAVAGALVGGPDSAAAVNVASQMGANAAENNCIIHKCYLLTPKPDSGLELSGKVGNGYYGREETLTALESIGTAWKDSGATKNIVVTEISQEIGPTPGHKTHDEGASVDIRPIRASGTGGLSYKDPNYDQPATQNLVNIIKQQYPDAIIYFNDPNIVGVKPWPGHNDHLHVGFK